ncbi:hypothetical protein FOPE_06399 [Fonsecaea pedrosoi]|nr:hypothetical protein FOPE_06399 [Fonsecaea pedrosoi]
MTLTLVSLRWHSLIGLTNDEIKKAASLCKCYVREQTKNAELTVHFEHITLDEPPKALLLPYIDAEDDGMRAHERQFVPRAVQMIYCEPGRSQPDEVVEANRIVLTDPDVRRRIAKLGPPADAQIQCDKWPYGADKPSTPEIPRLIQAMLYAQAPHNHSESNQYSFPIPMSSVIDMDQRRIVRVDELPSRDIGSCYANETLAETLSATPMAHCVGNENHLDIQYGKLRKDLKPLSIIQPEGTSFKVQGETVISWQKWQFRLAFNWREGMTIHNVRYDNRKLFYRLSLSEMTVPYGGLITAQVAHGEL